MWQARQGADRTIRLFSAAWAIFFRGFRGAEILTLIVLVGFGVRRSLRPMGRPASPGLALLP
ncbi:hypothetical protein WS62_17065 [Burkholderia sp. ABCPW 14]|nr:hypothetical protein WS62_17065 [Burkholderia sp. ABCPW 14]